MNWVTNSPEIAKRLKEADFRLELARLEARDLPLDKKIEAHRAAKIAHRQEHDKILNDHY